MRSKNPALAPLQHWTARIIARRGRRIAVVALARRLATMFYAMWRTNTPFQAARLHPAPVEAAA